MDNRKALHDYSIVMICLAVLNAFTFITTVISEFLDGSIQEALNKADADIIVAVKIFLAVIGVLLLILSFSDAFIGIKGLKISREPNADKGYIVAAKVFLVINILAVIFAVVSLINKNVSTFDGVINIANLLIDVSIYTIFIKRATAVYKDVINQAK